MKVFLFKYRGIILIVASLLIGFIFSTKVFGATYGPNVFIGGTCLEDSDQGNGCALAFDNDTSTFWQSGNTFPHWIGYDLGTTTTAKIAEIGFNYWNSGGNGIKTFKIQASSDNSTWHDIYSDVAQNDPDKTWAYFTFNNTTSTYRYWRAYLTDNYVGGTTNVLREMTGYEEVSTSTTSTSTTTSADIPNPWSLIPFIVGLVGLSGYGIIKSI